MKIKQKVKNVCLKKKKNDEMEYREIIDKYNRKIYACETHSFFNSLLPNFVH